LSQQTSHTIRWKYFFPSDVLPQSFNPENIAGKYIVENHEECVSVAYANIIDNGRPKWEFNITSIPICNPHCIISVSVNRSPKRTKDFIHFGAESIEYNSVTGLFNIKMEMIVLYSSKSVKFKHLGISGINIKIRNTYLISGIVKFSDFGKMMIEATNINYEKISNSNFNMPETSSNNITKIRSIIDIIADDAESRTISTSHNQSSDYSTVVTTTSSKTFPAFTISNTNTNTTFKQTNYSNLDNENNSEGEQTKNDEKKIILSDECANSIGESEEQDDEEQPKKRKRSTR
ncbi:3312_t:CDS:1, partial [Racocetra fulgida]